MNKIASCSLELPPFLFMIICFVILNLYNFREEVFGPVAPLLKFKTEEEAIRMANDTNAGILAEHSNQNLNAHTLLTL